MLEDVNAGIGWTLAHAEEHGGDPQRTYLVGQSCGAQLAALALVTQARRLPRPWRLPCICASCWTPRCMLKARLLIADAQCGHAEV